MSTQAAQSANIHNPFSGPFNPITDTGNQSLDLGFLELHQMLENDDPDDHRPLGKRSFFSSRFSAALAQRDLTASFLHTPFLTTAL